MCVSTLVRTHQNGCSSLDARTKRLTHKTTTPIDGARLPDMWYQSVPDFMSVKFVDHSEVKMSACKAPVVVRNMIDAILNELSRE
jgi:hypothetical protein